MVLMRLLTGQHADKDRHLDLSQVEKSIVKTFFCAKPEILAT